MTNKGSISLTLPESSGLPEGLCNIEFETPSYWGDEEYRAVSKLLTFWKLIGVIQLHCVVWPARTAPPRMAMPAHRVLQLATGISVHVGDGVHRRQEHLSATVVTTAFASAHDLRVLFKSMTTELGKRGAILDSNLRIGSRMHVRPLPTGAVPQPAGLLTDFNPNAAMNQDEYYARIEVDEGHGREVYVTGMTWEQRCDLKVAYKQKHSRLARMLGRPVDLYLATPKPGTASTMKQFATAREPQCMFGACGRTHFKNPDRLVTSYQQLLAACAADGTVAEPVAEATAAAPASSTDNTNAATSNQGQ